MDLQASLQESPNEQQCPPGTHTYLEVPIGTSVQEQRGMDRDDCSWVDDNSCKIACDIIITKGEISFIVDGLASNCAGISQQRTVSALYTHTHIMGMVARLSPSLWNPNRGTDPTVIQRRMYIYIYIVLVVVL